MQIIAKDVYYKYDQIDSEKTNWILQQVNVTIPSNSFISVIGHTGSGKSTLAKLIKGLIQPSAGSIDIGEQKKMNCDDKAKVNNKVGLVFQYPEHQLFEMTVLDDIAFGPKQLGWSMETISKEAEQVISALGLKKEILQQSPFQLSGGEKRKAALAGVMIMDPEVFILDEPAAGLDPVSRRHFMQLIESWRKTAQKTVILITHHMEDALAYSDEIIVMDKGKVLYQLPPNQLFLEHEAELIKIGLDIPDQVKLLHQLNRRLPEPIKVESLKEEHILEKIAEYYKKQEVTYGS
ncbi:ATP-binding cassette domain-containing protein [Bacillus vallismortis]|uniref:ATP-binding cassette domain-containing protein n=1 Tax=Bacillus vallismortis TaxID=72361 RepID=UPI002091CAAB|nr:ATP-binding cassette domain-containing protein [Bacillus vallismortis]MCO4852513.1 ATP-binding cassette domain-containing protein [Bacillus vallismortis]